MYVYSILALFETPIYIVLPYRLTSNHCVKLKCIWEEVPKLLDDIPLQIIIKILFQQDGALFHYDQELKEFLNRN